MITDEVLERYAAIFWRGWRKVLDLAPPWSSVADQHRAAVLNGVRAVLIEAGPESDKLASLFNECDRLRERIRELEVAAGG